MLPTEFLPRIPGVINRPQPSDWHPLRRWRSPSRLVKARLATRVLPCLGFGANGDFTSHLEGDGQPAKVDSMRPLLIAMTTGALIAGAGQSAHAADFALPPATPYTPYAAPAGPYEVEPPPIPYGARPPEIVPVAPGPYVYQGYSYCGYPAGWRGPGWYGCDYGPWVSGYGWGGPVGWRGWAWQGPYAPYREPYRGWRGGWAGAHGYR